MISEIFNCEENTVKVAVRRYGLPRKNPGRPRQKRIESLNVKFARYKMACQDGQALGPMEKIALVMARGRFEK